jgi:hypothetical protein
LDTDPSVRAFLDGETTVLPEFYVNRVRQELGSMFEHLPAGALFHDPNAYLASTPEEPAPVPLRTRRAG